MTIKFLSVLRKLNEKTGLYEYRDVPYFTGSSTDIDSFRPPQGWEWCIGEIWDVQDMGDFGYLVVEHVFDADAVLRRSQTYNTYKTIREANTAIKSYQD